MISHRYTFEIALCQSMPFLRFYGWILSLTYFHIYFFSIFPYFCYGCNLVGHHMFIFSILIPVLLVSFVPSWYLWNMTTVSLLLLILWNNFDYIIQCSVKYLKCSISESDSIYFFFFHHVFREVVNSLFFNNLLPI